MEVQTKVFYSERELPLLEVLFAVTMYHRAYTGWCVTYTWM
jgi:hypothetical protein